MALADGTALAAGMALAAGTALADGAAAIADAVVSSVTTVLPEDAGNTRCLRGPALEGNLQ
jgi:hypothetical protein